MLIIPVLLLECYTQTHRPNCLLLLSTALLLFYAVPRSCTFLNIYVI